MIRSVRTAPSSLRTPTSRGAFQRPRGSQVGIIYPCNGYNNKGHQEQERHGLAVAVYGRFFVKVGVKVNVFKRHQVKVRPVIFCELFGRIHFMAQTEIREFGFQRFDVRARLQLQSNRKSRTSLSLRSGSTSFPLPKK